MKNMIVLVILIFQTILYSQNSNESEEFEYFLLEFLRDMEFQIDRIKFPLEFIYYDSNADIDDDIKTVFKNKEEWKPFQDTVYVNQHYFRRIYDNFDRKLEKSGERVFSCEGNENGLNVNFYFKLINRKWILIKLENFST